MRKQTCILPIICLHLYSVSLRHEEKQKRHFIPMAHSPPSRHFIVQHTCQPRSQPETTTQTYLRQKPATRKKAHETRNFSGKIGHKQSANPNKKSGTTYTQAIPPPRHRKVQKEAWPTSWKKLATPIIKNEIISINKPGWQDTN